MRDVIVLPTYNEKENIRAMISEIFSVVPQVYIVVVDDTSPDGTAAIVKEMMKTQKHLSLIERPDKKGLGAAYKDAITHVLKDTGVRSIITMDADGSHDPRYIPVLLKALESHDLAVGSRYVRGGGIAEWEMWRMLLSKCGNLYARLLTRTNIKDLTAGFIAVRRELLEKVDFQHIGSGGYAYQIEFKVYCARKLHARIQEIPIMFQSRRGGESKLSNQIIHEGMRVPLKIFIRSLWKKK